jgi:hypothetical protein
MPMMVSAAKMIRTTAVVSMAGKNGSKLSRYSTPVLAEMTAVAKYDNRVRHAAREAVNLRVLFNRQL